MSKRPARAPRGRGARSNPDNRFSAHSRAQVDDGWGSLDEAPSALRTCVTADASRTVISYNASPDVPFDRSINPYRGCEHGCVYCFARPTHAWLGLSPGLDFETQLFYKADAAAQLKRELSGPSYHCRPITVGINTDAYQPTERRLRITRQILEVLRDCNHPLTIVTKSALVERDLDILGPMAQKGLLHVAVSVTTLQRDLSRTMEPRAATPERRLGTISALSAAGVPVSVLVAPLIPVLTDHELEQILVQARNAGARDAGYVLLRLPHELKGLFREWLAEHVPLKAAHVMNRIRDSYGGKDYDARFGLRMRGSGPYAELVQRRFALAYKKLGFAPLPVLSTDHFRVPDKDESQLTLF